MVVSGNTQFDSEMIDLSSTTAISGCPTAASHNGGAGQTRDGVGFFVDDKVIYCGGYDGNNNNVISKACHIYHFGNDSWTLGPTMNDKRRYPALAKMNDTHFWICGGRNSFGDAGHKTTEVYNTVTNSLSYYEDLPKKTSYQYLVKIDDTRYFTGGFGKSPDENKAWIFDSSDRSWTPRQDSTNKHNEGAACGVVTLSDGTKEIVVAGGKNQATTEIYSIATNTWRPSDNLPTSTERMSSVPYKTSFVAIGGRVGGSRIDSVLYFDPVLHTWETLPVTLQSARMLAVAVLTTIPAC